MSIKSDKWIKQKCTPAPFVITEMVASPQSPNNGVYWLPQKVERFVYMTQQQIHNAIADYQRSDIGIKAYRETTPEERAAFKPMISPYVADQVRESVTDLIDTTYGQVTKVGESKTKIVSYGTSSFGYDVRLANKFKIFTNINSGVIDPLAMDDRCYVDFEGDRCIIPPNSYVLGHTIETFDIPRDVMVLCVGKSTYARCGAIVNVTPIEAGFRGQVVIEISNATNLPLVVHANQGIAQFLFFQSDEACETSYADRGGKYQDQQGIVTARV